MNLSGKDGKEAFTGVGLELLHTDERVEESEEFAVTGQEVTPVQPLHIEGEGTQSYSTQCWGLWYLYVHLNINAHREYRHLL